MAMAKNIVAMLCSGSLSVLGRFQGHQEDPSRRTCTSSGIEPPITSCSEREKGR
ncbi:uncharacterized protein BO88DRAFT_406511 [Aspergillus vadensis CBS 113365]|nr:hypothetical protein BO88DRAFT_406511 [Aspergillus vadensis CBS 113365]PYH66839.1 hypothetical protein BO88DRAFT_406511 [Aspergillus vadensis CBS 113365]